MNTDPRVDTYIAKSKEFAQPILNHLRELIHVSCSDVTETIKWNFPHFEYKGAFVAFASFKEHCSVVFQKAELMSDPNNLFEKVGKTAMGQMGQIKSLEDLPEDQVFIDYLKEALEINEQGIKPKSKPAKPGTARQLDIPDYMMDAIKSNKKALATFEALSPSHKNEYTEWIVEAKREATREKRIKTMLEFLEEGKSKEWKYMKTH